MKPYGRLRGGPTDAPGLTDPDHAAPEAAIEVAPARTRQPFAAHLQTLSSAASDPAVLRWLSLATVIAVLALIASGAWVRLSSSGLGCPTWPNCTSHTLVAPDRYHALIEFVNRCVISAVGVLVVLTALASLIRKPKRLDLRLLAGGLVVGYLGEAVLGGLTVLLKLAPALVACHLLLAMALLADAVVLYWRSERTTREATVLVDRNLTWLTSFLLLVFSCGVVVGTVVTGSGPHSGSPGTPRFHLSFGAVAHLHAVIGMFLFGLTVALFFALRAAHPSRSMWRRYGVVVALMALQGALGYATYFTLVETGVAEAHVLGGGLLLAALVWLRLGFRSETPRRHEGPTIGAESEGDLGVQSVASAPESSNAPAPASVGGVAQG